MTKLIAFSEAEFSALTGLPFVQRSLYLILRWYMDRVTGRTGDRRGISYQSLAEELYVEPVRGRHASESGSPSKKAVRSALALLEKEGLIRSVGGDENLVFFLPKAHRKFVRPNDEGHMRGTHEGHDERQASGLVPPSFEGDERHDEGHGVNGDEGHTSRVKVNPLSVVAAAAALPTQPVDNSFDVNLLLQQPSDVSDWLRAAEKRRGKVVGAVATDTRIAAWLSKGLRIEGLREAYRLAVADRESHKAPEPINLGFLDIFVRRVLGHGMVSKVEGAATPAVSWQSTEDGVRQKALDLGVEPWRDGEGFSEFRGRVLFAADQKARAENKHRVRK